MICVLKSLCRAESKPECVTNHKAWVLVSMSGVIQTVQGSFIRHILNYTEYSE